MQSNPGHGAGLALRAAGGTQALGMCAWERQQGTPGDGALAVFAPGPLPAGVEADEDLALLPQLQLIAQGSAPGDNTPRAPFRIVHSITSRVVALQTRVLAAGEQADIHPGETLQLGLRALVFVVPPHASEAPDAPVDGHDAVLADPAQAVPADVDIADALADARDGWDVTGDPLLDELHGRYHALLADPAALGEQSSLNLALTFAAARQQAPDPLAALTGHEPGEDVLHQSLHDLLVAPGTMDALIARTDALGPQDILEMAAPESVLLLFAPAAVQAGAALRANASLASLTRREHHMHAADTALPSLGAQVMPQLPQPSADA